MNNLKKFYSDFLKGHEGKIHLASHSHYFWPDKAFDGYKDYWNLAKLSSDKKWDYIFSTELPKAQKRISKILNFNFSERIAFAPNTQELLARLISCFQEKEQLNILTTTSEFHSFSRQVKRLEELKKVKVDYVENEVKSFQDDFLKKINSRIDIIFVSQVFFNSGIVLNHNFLKQIIQKKNEDTIFIVDGYHGFCAVKTDLQDIIEDIYYLSGSYKYAQAGEGMCFMTTPKDCKLRPVNTGWFASFSDLESPKKTVEYANNGFRFSSSTLDFSTLFKFNRIWDHFEEQGISYLDIIAHSKSMQKYFLSNLSSNIKDNYILPNTEALFTSIVLPTEEEAQKLQQNLATNGILVDRRKTRVRFSFAAYIAESDIDAAIELINWQI